MPQGKFQPKSQPIAFKGMPLGIIDTHALVSVINTISLTTGLISKSSNETQAVAVVTADFCTAHAVAT